MLPAYADEHLAALEPEALIGLMAQDEDRVPRERHRALLDAPASG